jgi:hypothetical protein
MAAKGMKSVVCNFFQQARKIHGSGTLQFEGEGFWWDSHTE